MGFKDSLFNTLGFGGRDQEEYDQDYDYDQPYEETAYEEAQEKPSRRLSRLTSRNAGEEEGMSSYGGNMRMVLLQPTRFEEAENIASYLLSGKAVVFDLQECDVETAINIVNFVSGAIFALDGAIQKINERGAIFVATPASVSLDNELRETIGAGDFGPSVAEWVNHAHTKEDFID